LKNNPNKKAKKMTTTEFEDNMAALVEQEKRYWPDPKQPPLFCFDNDKVQKLASLTKMGLKHWQKVEIPPHSPDFNQPIEHIFNTLKTELRNELYAYGDVVDAKWVQQTVLKIFKHIKKRSIRKNVDNLPLTYLAVMTDKGVTVTSSTGKQVVGSGGAYPGAARR
jgi:hypothetical protein